MNRIENRDKSVALFIRLAHIRRLLSEPIYRLATTRFGLEAPAALYLPAVVVIPVF